MSGNDSPTKIQKQLTAEGHLCNSNVLARTELLKALPIVENLVGGSTTTTQRQDEFMPDDGLKKLIEELETPH